MAVAPDIVPLLPAHPIASAATIRVAIGARNQRALEGLKVLAERGVIRQISPGDCDRHFAAEQLSYLVEAFDDQLDALS